MNLPLISIVVCTHNRAESLRAAVCSLYDLKTHGRFEYEIVVIDNASTDATPEVVTTAARECGHPVRYVFEGRKGISSARNRGVREAAGQWIAFFDDDQAADPQWLAALFDLATEKQVDGVGGPVVLQLPAGCTRRLADPCRMLLGEADWSNEPIPYDDYRTPGAGNLMLRREVFDRIGWFDESVGSRGEDTDLYRRMQRHGLTAWYSPQAIILHIIPPNRLEDAYLLNLAERMGQGVANYEAASRPRRVLLFRWVAKRVRALLVFQGQETLARWTGHAERALGYRCLLSVSTGYHQQLGAILFPPRRLVTAGQPTADRCPS